MSSSRESFHKTEQVNRHKIAAYTVSGWELCHSLMDGWYVKNPKNNQRVYVREIPHGFISHYTEEQLFDILRKNIWRRAFRIIAKKRAPRYEIHFDKFVYPRIGKRFLTNKKTTKV